MSRPRTKGDPIQFRLPIDAHNTIAAKASAKNQTVNEYVAAYVARAAEALKEKGK